jgi:hypothetical protein
MDFEHVAEALSDHDLTPEEVQEIAESVGMAYAEAGAKRQHQEYEPDEVKTGLVAPVPEESSQEATVAVLQELCWETVEQGHAKRKESYARKDD